MRDGGKVILVQSLHASPGMARDSSFDAPPPSSVDSNPLRALAQYGQSVWLDFLSRGWLKSGELARRIAEDGVTGVTSNPAIFQKAIEGSQDYASAIAEQASQAGLSPKRAFEVLAVRDVQDAADVLRPVYDKTAGADGFVSLEVAPDIALDTTASIEEGRRLWREVGRPNLMIKIPGTAEGLPAIRELLGEGINVNITLLFARSTYEKVAEIYLEAPDRQRRRRAAGRARQEGERARAPGAREPGWHGRDRERQARLSELPRPVLGAALALARGSGGEAAARALGEHRHQEPELQ